MFNKYIFKAISFFRSPRDFNYIELEDSGRHTNSCFDKRIDRNLFKHG